MEDCGVSEDRVTASICWVSLGFLEEVAWKSGLRRELRDQQAQFSLSPDEKVETQRERTAHRGSAG